MKNILLGTGLLVIAATLCTVVSAQTQMPLPAQTTTYTGLGMRGYWFQAPTDFTITGARVPTDASSGDQTVEIVSFASQPTGTGITNFTPLFYQTGVAGTGVISTGNISVTSGTWIGIIGARDTTAINSYAPNSYVSDIGGNSVTLTRLCANSTPVTAQSTNFFTNDASIGRVELYYILPNTAPSITSTAPTAAISGNAYTYTPTAIGSPAPSFSISPDPATLGSGWLTWNGTTLSGTPGTGDIGIDIGPLTLTATNGVNPDATEVFTVTVSAPSPEIEVLDPNSTSVTSGATMTVYAATAGASSTGTFTINNTGSNPLNFTGTPIVDKGSSENNCTVTVTQPTTNPLPATTGTDTFALDIVPTAAGTFSFSVTILSDDADEGTFVINFTGEAKATAEQEIAVWDQNSASIANGGTYTENNTGTAQFNSPFTVRNEGGAALNLTGTTAVAVSGQNNCTVVINQPASTTMAAAGTWLATSEAFSFDITPTAAGAFSFTVTIDNNDTDEGTFTYTFSGNTATPSSTGGGGGGGGGCSTGGDSPYSWMVLLGLLSAFVVFTRMRSSKA